MLPISSYYAHYAALQGFPSDDSIAALPTLGVTHLFVHLNELAPDAEQRLNAQPMLREQAREGEIVLYQLDKSRR